MTRKKVQKSYLVTRDWAFFSEHPANCNSVQTKKPEQDISGINSDAGFASRTCTGFDM